MRYFAWHGRSLRLGCNSGRGSARVVRNGKVAWRIADADILAQEIFHVSFIRLAFSGCRANLSIPGWNLRAGGLEVAVPGENLRVGDVVRPGDAKTSIAIVNHVFFASDPGNSRFIRRNASGKYECMSLESKQKKRKEKLIKVHWYTQLWALEGMQWELFCRYKLLM